MVYDEHNKEAYETIRPKRKRGMNLITQEVYKSDKYIATGNIAYQITITRLKDNRRYILSYNELNKFREYWADVYTPKKDKFIDIILTENFGKELQLITKIGA